MTRPALSVVGAGPNRAPIELRGDDRLSGLTAPIRDASFAMAACAAASLAVHALLMAVAGLSARAPLVVPQSQEIAVEIVREEPRQAPSTPPALKPESPKAEQPAKVEPPAPTKTEQTKVERAQPLAAQKSAVADQLKAMQDELASLRAEQAALKATEAQEEGAGRALALPSIGGSDGDAIGYQQLVFSQLAKAKGDAEYHGQAGSTGVKFQMDEAGKLIRVEVVRSSGSALLDGQALDIIHRAAPFPPPPTEADRIVFANVNFVPPKAR